MYKIKEKVQGSPNKKRPGNSFLRLIRAGTDFQSSIVGVERTGQASYPDCLKACRNAMLEAERTKAMTTMALQQQRQRFR